MNTDLESKLIAVILGLSAITGMVVAAIACTSIAVTLVLGIPCVIILIIAVVIWFKNG